MIVITEAKSVVFDVDSSGTVSINIDGKVHLYVEHAKMVYLDHSNGPFWHE